MHVRREQRDDDAGFGPLDDGVEGSPDAFLAARRAARIDVGRIAHQEANAFARECLEALDVEELAVRRGVVELEVARMHDEPGVGANGQGGRVGNRVGDANRLDLERPDPHDVARVDAAQIDVVQHFVLRGSFANEPERIGRREDGHVEAAKQVRDGADVIS